MGEGSKNTFNPETGKAEAIPESALARAEETTGARELTKEETKAIVKTREDKNNLNPIEMGVAAHHGWIRGVGEAFGVPVDTGITGIASLFGDDAKESTKAYLAHLEEAHPYVSGWYGALGQVGGALTAAELTGAPGRVGAGVVPRTLGGVAARMGVGGVENVVAATTHDVNETSLGRADLNGEKLAANIPKHFAVGATLTGLFEGAGAGLEAGVGALRREAVPALERGASKALGQEAGEVGEGAVAAGDRIRAASRTHLGEEIPKSRSGLVDALEAEQRAAREKEASAYTEHVDKLRGEQQTEAAARAAEQEAGRLRVAREGAKSVEGAERAAAEGQLDAAARGGARVETLELEGAERRSAAQENAFEAWGDSALARERAGGAALHDATFAATEPVRVTTEHYASLANAIEAERAEAMGLAMRLGKERDANAKELGAALIKVREGGHVPAGKLTPDQFDAILDEYVGIVSGKHDPNVRWAAEQHLREVYKDELEGFASATEAQQGHIDRLTKMASDLERAHTEAIEHVKRVDEASRAIDKEAQRAISEAGAVADKQIKQFQQSASKEAEAAGKAADQAMERARKVEAQVEASIEDARGLGEKEVAKAAKAGEAKIAAARAEAEASRAKYEHIVKEDRKALAKQQAKAESSVEKPTGKTDVDPLIEGVRARSDRASASSAVSNGAMIGAGISVLHGHPLGAIMTMAGSFAASRARAHGNIAAARVMRALSEQIGKMDTAIQRGAASLFSSVGSRASAAASRVDVPKQKLPKFEAVSRHIVDAQANPSLVEAHVRNTLGPVAIHAPDTYAQVLAAAQRQQAFLEAVLPIPQRDSLSISPHLHDDEVSATEKDEFMRLFSVVQDPLNLFRETRDGTVSPEQVEAVKFVYGKGLYQQMVAETRKQIEQLEHPIDYEREMAIGELLGEPTNEILDRDFQSAMSASYTDKSAAQAPMGGSKPTGGASKLAKDVMSTSEKMQRGD